MPKPTLDEMVEKVKRFGNVLRGAVAHNRELRKQEEFAINSAIRIQSMHREKFIKEQKNKMGLREKTDTGKRDIKS